MTTAQFPTYSIKGKQVEYKTVSFLVKSVDQDLGIVTGLASPVTQDRQRDIVESGAYTKTLNEVYINSSLRIKINNIIAIISNSIATNR